MPSHIISLISDNVSQDYALLSKPCFFSYPFSTIPFHNIPLTIFKFLNVFYMALCIMNNVSPWDYVVVLTKLSLSPEVSHVNLGYGKLIAICYIQCQELAWLLTVYKNFFITLHVNAMEFQF